MNSLIALGLAMGVYLLHRNRSLLSGAAVAMPTVIVKFLALIYAPGFLFASRRKLWSTLGFAGLILLVYVPFGVAGADLKTPIHVEGAHITAGNSIYLAGLLSGIDIPLRVPDALLGLSWLFYRVLTFLAMRPASGDSVPARRRTLYLLTLSLIAELLCVQIFSKNTWDLYLVMAMFPLCMLAAELSFGEIIAYGIYIADIVFEPSYWADNGFVTPLKGHAMLVAHSAFARNLACTEFRQAAGSIFLWVAVIRRLLALRTKPIADELEPTVPMHHPSQAFTG